MAYDGIIPARLAPAHIFEDFINILRRQRAEDIANQNRAIIAAIIAKNVGGPVAPALAQALAQAPGPMPAMGETQLQQDSNDPNIGCIGTPGDPNIGCVSIA